MVSVAGIVFSIFVTLTPVALGLQTVDFQNEILPVLQQHCYRCHGPSEQEAGLRLDRKTSALEGGDSGALWVAGDRNSSLLYQRVAGLDDLDQMPPDGEPLSGEFIERIGRWIDGGAPWPDDESTSKKHWAYIAPARPHPPATTDTDWPINEIDHFILTRLEQSGINPSPPAERARLLRRVYLDLIGLPPTVEEIDAFLAEPGPSAYETVVDRLLASKHYGERWAVPWLDAARYADSNGYQADQYREVWPYRDWVVNALNADMPFDQFTIEQIAGDLVKGSTTDQKIATGFHRQTTCNVEAGVDPEENRVNQIIDRVNTTGTVWLGTTLQCAQCHDHKYDPFDQRDYYRLFAYFNNTPREVKHTTATTYDFFGPKLDVPLPDNSTAEQRRLKKDFQAARDALDRYLDDLVSRQAVWEQQQRELIAASDAASSLWHVASVIEFQSSGGASHQVLADGSILISGERPDKDTYTIRLSTKLSDITALRLEALTHGSLPGKGPGRHHPERPNFVLNEIGLQLESNSKPDRGERIGLTNPWADYSQPNYDVAGAIDGLPGTAWAIHQEFHQPHVATFAMDKPLRIESQQQTLLVTLEQNHGGCRTLGRFRISFSAETPPPQSATVDQRPPADIAEILMIDPSGRTEDQQDRVVEYYRAAQPEYQQLTRQVADLKKQLGDAMSATTLVMVEMDSSRESRMLKRGDFRTPSEQVQPGTPTVLHPVSNAESGDRLELARWLVSRDNPLTARVTVNRWWSEIFGHGIVRTTEDFGTQGQRPSHPQLLDWLAVELMANGWSMKHIHKLIVMSATYRQSSRVTPALLDHDPENRLLARGPRFRLGAEAIRDNALRISGLLTTKLGGPPVYPPQPGGVWRHVGRNPPKYRVETGEARYGRGLYVVWRRSAPYPSFVNFDAPDRAACVVQRSRANTPLQALTLLNDEAYVEMAWAFAARIAQRGSDEVKAIKFGFRSCVARQPTEGEVRELLAVFRGERDRLQKDSKTTKLMIGNYSRPADVTPAEFAAWFYVATILLNLDETITKG